MDSTLDNLIKEELMKEEKSIVFGDLHIPFHDDKAVLLMLKFLKLYQPDRIFINGDLLDCWSISKFAKPVDLEVHLADEITEAKDFFRCLRKIAPKAKIVYIFGNHEFRFEKYLAQEAGMFRNLEGMSLQEQLKCDHFENEVINKHLKENYYRYGHLLIGHWNKANKFSGYTVKNLMEEKGMSMIQNHTHRGAQIFKRDYKDIYCGVENFCLCDINPHYLSLPNWQLGFCTISTDATGFFRVSLRPIIDYNGRYQVKFGEQVLSISK